MEGDRWGHHIMESWERIGACKGKLTTETFKKVSRGDYASGYENTVHNIGIYRRKDIQ